MKKICFNILFSFVLFSCQKQMKSNEEVLNGNTTHREYDIGADKDEHGCIVSAGFTWSVLKNDCIRIFEIGYRMNPVKVSFEDEAILNAFVLFNENEDKVEVFLPNVSGSIILEKSNKTTFKNDIYLFDSNEFNLYKNKEKIFEGAKENLKNIDEYQEEIEDNITI